MFDAYACVHFASYMAPFSWDLGIHLVFFTGESRYAYIVPAYKLH